MQDYVFVISHKKGKDNVVADALSRRTHDTADVQRMLILSIVETRVVGFEQVKDAYVDCPNFGEIVVALTSGPTPEYPNYILSDGYLFHRRRLCVPDKRKNAIVECALLRIKQNLYSTLQN